MREFPCNGIIPCRRRSHMGAGNGLFHLQPDQFQKVRTQASGVKKISSSGFRSIKPINAASTKSRVITTSSLLGSQSLVPYLPQKALSSTVQREHSDRAKTGPRPCRAIRTRRIRLYRPISGREFSYPRESLSIPLRREKLGFFANAKYLRAGPDLVRYGQIPRGRRDLNLLRLTCRHE